MKILSRLFAVLLGLSLSMECALGTQPERVVRVKLCCSRIALSADGSFSTSIESDGPLPSPVHVQLELLDANGAVVETRPLSLTPSSMFTRVDFQNSQLKNGGVLRLGLSSNSPPSVGLGLLVAARLVPRPTSIGFSLTNGMPSISGTINLGVRTSHPYPDSLPFTVRQISGERRDANGALLPLVVQHGYTEYDSPLTTITLSDISADSTFVLESGAIVVNPAYRMFSATVAPQPVFAFDATTTVAAPGVGVDLLVVRRDRNNSGGAIVQFATQDITARAGEDYLATTGALNFLPGERQKRFRIPVLPTATLSNRFAVTLSSTNAVLVGGSARVTIQRGIVFEKEDYLLNADGATTLQLILAPPSSSPISARLIANSWSLPFTFPAGTTHLALPLKLPPIPTPLPLRIVECAGCGDPISLRARATVYPNGADTDTVFVVAESLAGPFMEGEPLPISLFRTGMRENALTVHFSVAGGTARPGEDFTRTHGTVTFAPGEAQASALIESIRDDREESPEHIVVVFSSADPKVRVPGPRILTLLDGGSSLEQEQAFWSCCNDRAWLSQNSAGVEGTIAEFRVESYVETFRYWTTDQTARMGVDYVVGGEIGTNGMPFRIEFPDNGLVQGKKTFRIHFASLSGFDPPVTNSFNITIHDDEIPNSIDERFRAEIPTGFAPEYLDDGSTEAFPRADGSLLLHRKGKILHLGPTGDLLRMFDLGLPAVGASTFLPDGRIVASACVDEGYCSELVKFNSDFTRDLQFKPDLPTGTIGGVAPSGDGKLWVCIATPAGSQLLRLSEEGGLDPSYPPVTVPAAGGVYVLGSNDILIRSVACFKIAGCRYFSTRVREGLVIQSAEERPSQNFVLPGTPEYPWHPLLGDVRYVATQSDGNIIAWRQPMDTALQLVRILVHPPGAPHRLIVRSREDARGEGDGELHFELFRTGDAVNAAWVRVKTEEILRPFSLYVHAATAHQDYKPTDQVIPFLAGQSRVAFSVPLLQDDLSEGWEAFDLTFPETSPEFQNPITPERAYILDDDPALSPVMVVQPNGALALGGVNYTGRVVEVLVSDDLVHWTSYARLTGTDLKLPLTTEGPRKFYRLKARH